MGVDSVAQVSDGPEAALAWRHNSCAGAPPSLDRVTTHKQGKIHVDPKDIEGLRLEATDMDWSWGDGDLVSGPAEAILMGLNRRDVSADLTGDGVTKLPT